MKPSIKINIILVTGMILLLLPSFVFSQAATLVYTTGDIQIKRADQVRTFSPNEVPVPMRQGDLIRTSPRSTAIIQFPDETSVKINPDSIVSLRQIRENRRQFYISQGTMMARVTHLSTGDKFHVVTPSVVAGVRGTQFFIGSAGTEEEPSDLWLCVNDGVVEVESVDSGDKVEVKRGEGVFVEKGQSITDPQEYEWTSELNWNMDPNAGSVEERIRLDDLYTDLLDYDYD
jgi:hypothetical protein